MTPFSARDWSRIDARDLEARSRFRRWAFRVAMPGWAKGAAEAGCSAREVVVDLPQSRHAQTA